MLPATLLLPDAFYTGMGSRPSLHSPPNPLAQPCCHTKEMGSEGQVLSPLCLPRAPLLSSPLMQAALPTALWPRSHQKPLNGDEGA